MVHLIILFHHPASSWPTGPSFSERCQDWVQTPNATNDATGHFYARFLTDTYARSISFSGADAQEQDCWITLHNAASV